MLATLAVMLPPRVRAVGTTVLVVFGVLFSLNRVFIGAHFLSDVILAWWVTLPVIAIEYWLLYLNPPEALTNESMEAWLTEAGMNLRRGAVSLWQAITGRGRSRGEEG